MPGHDGRGCWEPDSSQGEIALDRCSGNQLILIDNEVELRNALP
jgi:hypothetical protein